MNRKIIAFAGRKRSGKTCLAKLLQQEENAIIADNAAITNKAFFILPPTFFV